MTFRIYNLVSKQPHLYSAYVVSVPFQLHTTVRTLLFSLGVAVCKTASTENVPLPCMGTVVQTSGSTSATLSKPSRIFCMVEMNSVSLDPRSLSIAFFTDGLVVKGPGVKSFLSPEI